MLPGWALGWNTICWRTRGKVEWTSSYYQINLIGLRGKLDFVIGLWLFYCNRLALDTHPWPFSLYKERHGAPLVDAQSYNQSNAKGTRRLDVKAITRKRARASINRSSLCFTVKFCVRQSPSNITSGTPVVSCQYQTPTASTPGRGFRWLCNRELGGPR
jgi:hypothetical protein